MWGRRTWLVGVLLLTIGCGADDGDASGQDVSYAKDSWLRAKSAVRVAAGDAFADEELAHTPIGDDISEQDAEQILAGALTPTGFFSESQPYVLSLAVGDEIVIEIDGPDMWALIRAFERSPGTLSQHERGDTFVLRAATSGDHLVLVYPAEVKSDTSAAIYDISFSTP